MMNVTSKVEIRVVLHKGNQVGEIILNGKNTHAKVSSIILETAIQYKDFYLLFMTDGTPFEDMLSIYLFDKHFKLLDKAIIGGPYTTGNFVLLFLNEPNKIQFRFIGDTIWTITLMKTKKIHIPITSEAKGVYRPFSFFRYFKIKGNPKQDIT